MRFEVLSTSLIVTKIVFFVR
ncbi:Hypothetical protein SPCCCB_spr1755 [Streptococcus pneumoniae CCCB]|uniref:Uncharacterized protein n=1 Tax=Streptococcus pneumoniae (strain ATCC BAA-255 / R6) TaxID=171101 RepID=Q8CYA3_STRR6|nr:Hypothetical protein spr1755 [Streptococcus pneumoniae R6]OLV90974.1 Hypothetical protein SPCCCB_spr1755 [Streptococcus pneumoniae CCCB]